MRSAPTEDCSPRPGLDTRTVKVGANAHAFHIKKIGNDSPWRCFTITEKHHVEDIPPRRPGRRRH